MVKKNGSKFSKFPAKGLFIVHITGTEVKKKLKFSILTIILYLCISLNL